MVTIIKRLAFKNYYCIYDRGDGHFIRSAKTAHCGIWETVRTLFRSLEDSKIFVAWGESANFLWRNGKTELFGAWSGRAFRV